MAHAGARQGAQTRGLVVLNSPIGLVACLPIGMAQISSVVLTAEWSSPDPVDSPVSLP